MKPDGVSDNVYNDLINALEKAILLIYDMSIRKGVRGIRCGIGINQ